MKNIDKTKIKIPLFEFKNNTKIKKYIDSLFKDSYNFNQICKLINITTNKLNTDIIIHKLESKAVQSKIIKKLKNYNKKPIKTLNYFKNNCDKDISYEDIINAILKYLNIKYNEQSIFWIDIDTIYFNGWNKNELNEEGPREYIHNLLCSSKNICIVM